jgi:hypothetical protein
LHHPLIEVIEPIFISKVWYPDPSSSKEAAALAANIIGEESSEIDWLVIYSDWGWVLLDIE